MRTGEVFVNVIRVMRGVAHNGRLRRLNAVQLVVCAVWVRVQRRAHCLFGHLALIHVSMRVSEMRKHKRDKEHAVATGCGRRRVSWRQGWIAYSSAQSRSANSLLASQTPAPRSTCTVAQNFLNIVRGRTESEACRTDHFREILAQIVHRTDEARRAREEIDGGKLHLAKLDACKLHSAIEIAERIEKDSYHVYANFERRRYLICAFEVTQRRLK